MRKIVIAIVTGCVIAGGGAWYAFSYLPAQIRGEIDATIASLAPRVIVNYGTVDIDIFKRRAVFTDVTVQENEGGMFGDARRMTVSADGAENAFDVMLEEASMSVTKNPADKFLAATVRLDELSVDPAPDRPSTEKLAFLRRLNLRKLTIDKIRSIGGYLKSSGAVLENLSDARFAKAAVMDIHGKEAGKFEFSTAAVRAERIDIHQIATLPRTFRGNPDWTKLNTGKVSVERFRVKLPNMNMSVAETLSDGIDSGRILRFRIGNVKMGGRNKNGIPYSVGLEKFVMNNFPITIFQFNINLGPDLQTLRNIQSQHKNPIFDGFDIRNLKFSLPQGNVEIRHVTFPKPVFRNTPSGKQYAAKAELSMDLRGDFGDFKKIGKLQNPVLDEIFKDLKGRMIMTARTSSDHEEKTGTVEAMDITVPGVARLKLSGRVGNLPLRYYEAPNDPVVQQIAGRQVTLGELNLTFINEGLAEALLEDRAKQISITPKEFARRLAVMVHATVAADASPEGRAIAREIGKFLYDPRSIRLSLKPKRPLPVMALANPQLLQSAGKVSRILGLTIEANKTAK